MSGLIRLECDWKGILITVVTHYRILPLLFG